MENMEKLKKYFDGMIVKKDSVAEQFAALSIPAFIRDWFIKKYADNEGNIDVNFVASLIKKILPTKENLNEILDNLMYDHKTLKFMARILVSIDVSQKKLVFELPDLGITEKQTYIYSDVWEKCKEDILSSNGPVWGIITLSYKNVQIGKKEEGKIVLDAFQNFRPYRIDLEYFKKTSKFFEFEEWIDVLLGAIDYNANAYKDIEEKIMVITRLLPFVEKRLNLIELAPKGTGKSYLFSQISKHGWLNTGGVITRAKMFYDMHQKQEGLVSNYDYVALDEISTIKFSDPDEIQGALKGYLESGAYTVGVNSGKGDAGLILLGNIKQDKMNVNVDMLDELPYVFHESALLDRFHGFIEGWKIPRMTEDKKIRGWALNTEYFAEIMHEFRDDITYGALVDALLEVDNSADTRDVKAVKRIASAYLKLLFPHYQKLEDVDREMFEKYCLKPAIHMRQIVKTQMGIIDEEFKGKNVCNIRMKEELGLQ